LPVPISTPVSTQRLPFTAHLCITRDPETGVRNMGTYRAALKKNRPARRDAWPHALEARAISSLTEVRALGQPMPCAIVIGCAPIVIYTGPQKFAANVDEMTVAGGAAGAPIRIAKCVTIDLEVPADAEIVIEGLIDSDLLEPEGRSVKQRLRGALGLQHDHAVTAITHRRKPVFASILSQVTRRRSS